MGQERAEDPGFHALSGHPLENQIRHAAVSNIKLVFLKIEYKIALCK